MANVELTAFLVVVDKVAVLSVAIVKVANTLEVVRLVTGLIET